MSKPKIVLTSTKKDYPIITFLDSIVNRDRVVMTPGIIDVPIPFDDETDSAKRAEVMSRACLQNACEQRPDTDVVVSVACFAGYDDGVFPDSGGVGVISDPANDRELRDFFTNTRADDSDELGSYFLYISASLCFPKKKQRTSIIQVAFREEIPLTIPKSICTHTIPDYKHSGPNTPFEGYFKQHLADADSDLVNLSGKLARKIQKQCSDRGYTGLFISRGTGQRKK